MTFLEWLTNIEEEIRFHTMSPTDKKIHIDMFKDYHSDHESIKEVINRKVDNPNRRYSRQPYQVDVVDLESGESETYKSINECSVLLAEITGRSPHTITHHVRDVRDSQTTKILYDRYKVCCHL